MTENLFEGDNFREAAERIVRNTPDPMLQHDYNAVMDDPELRAKLNWFIAWVLRSKTPAEREIRITFIQDWAKRRLAEIREKN